MNTNYDYSVPPSSATNAEVEVEGYDEEDVTVTTDNTTAAVNNQNNTTSSLASYGNNNSMMMMPPSMMYGAGGYGMGYGGMMGYGPFSGLYQVLYGVQNVIYSISQAVQLIGMNQQLLQQAYESISQMIDHTIKTFREMRAIELEIIHQKGQPETEEEKQRRNRLKALRYALVFGGSWLAYKVIRWIVKADGDGRRRLQNQPHNNNNNLFYNNMMGGGASNYGYGSGSNGYGMSSPHSPYSSYGTGMGGYGGYSSAGYY
jgi:hypothetical protein